MMLLLALVQCGGPEKQAEPIEPAENLPQPTIQVLAEDLVIPWELLWGPDNRLWMTNNYPFCVLRLDPDTKQLDSLFVDDSNALPAATMAFMGLAVHPRYPEVPWVYLSHMGPLANGQIGMGVSRFRVEDNQLVDRLVILDDLYTENSWLPGGCLAIVDSTYLMVATSNEHTPNDQSRNVEALNGKLLRYNLDGTIPQDNPFPNSPVYSFGHRNPQGISQRWDGVVAACEHGPSADDEVNLIRAGVDFGWPDVSGAMDTPEEKALTEDNPVQSPLRAWTPTIAPSSVCWYRGPKYPALTNGLLVTTLKEADLRVLYLNEGERGIKEETILLDKTLGRLRNLAVSPEGRVFVCTGNRIPENFGFARPVPEQEHRYDVVVEVQFPTRENAPTGVQ